MSLFLKPPEIAKPSFFQKLLQGRPIDYIEEHANAKVNLYLQVIGKRPDGYHDLDSLIVFCDLHDTIIMRRAKQFMLVSEGLFAKNLPQTGSNLIHKTVHLFAEELKQDPNIFVEIKKSIPVAAGLGGGSADAAACIRALSRFWSFSLNNLDMNSVARLIGSDVPVCIRNQTACICKRGEIVVDGPALPEFSFVLVNPNFMLETKDVFNNLTVLPRENANFSKADLSTPQKLVDWLRDHQNDLMSPASGLKPSIVKVFRALSKTEGCLMSRLSGSGPTCFGVFATKAEADKAARAIQKENPEWWVRATGIK